MLNIISQNFLFFEWKKLSFLLVVKFLFSFGGLAVPSKKALWALSFAPVGNLPSPLTKRPHGPKNVRKIDFSKRQCHKD